MSYSETITRTDLTNILNSILPQSSYIQSWEYVSDVYWWGNTWTVPDDGFIEVYVEPSASNWYWRISDSKAPDTGWSHRLSGANALTVSQEFFVKKGAVLGTYDMNAINTAHVYYYKFTLKETIPESAVDYIVEQGTSGEWTYRKWSSGIAECWRQSGSYSEAMTNNYGNGNYYTTDYFGFPSNLFTSVKYVDVHRAGGTGVGLVSTSVYSYSTTRVDFYIWNNGSSLTTNLAFSIYAKGTWK